MSELKTIQEAERWLLDWTRQILKKWMKVGITEAEAQQLLCFWADDEFIPTLAERRNASGAKRDKKRPYSLYRAAAFYGKDPRTIRRWCEKGFFGKGARRTKPGSGHWRIDLDAVDMPLESVARNFARKPKTIFGTKIWKEFEVEIWKIFGGGVGLLFDVAGALGDKSGSELKNDIRSKNTDSNHVDRVWDIVTRISRAPETYEGKKLKRTPADILGLQSLARRVYLNDPVRPTAKWLAGLLKISVATLYRRYGKQVVQSTLAYVVNPPDLDGAQHGPCCEREKVVDERSALVQLDESIADINDDLEVP